MTVKSPPSTTKPTLKRKKSSDSDEDLYGATTPPPRRVKPNPHVEVTANGVDMIAKAQEEGEKKGRVDERKKTMKRLAQEVCKLLASGDVETAFKLEGVLITTAREFDVPRYQSNYTSCLAELHEHVKKFHPKNGKASDNGRMYYGVEGEPECVKLAKKYGDAYYETCTHAFCQQKIKMMEFKWDL